MNPLRIERASPYVIGALIGVLSWITFATMGEALGTSTTMVRGSGLIAGAVAPEHVGSNAYYQGVFGTAESPKPKIDWQFALVLMLIPGAFVAARLAGSRHRESVPSLWAWRFGASRARRFAAAFAGGVVMIFGARLAGGCTSGHGISGSLQLALSSWTFLGGMFVAGVATAFALFGKEGRNHVG